jgi:hypothetical protein
MFFVVTEPLVHRFQTNENTATLKKAVIIPAIPGCRRIKVRKNHNKSGKMNAVGLGIGNDPMT